MERLQTVCRSCREPFFTDKQVSRSVWWREAWAARRECCSHCGEWRTYVKSEFFYV